MNSWLRRHGRNLALAVLALVTAVVVTVALSIPKASDQAGTDRPPGMLENMIALFTDR